MRRVEANLFGMGRLLLSSLLVYKIGWILG